MLIQIKSDQGGGKRRAVVASGYFAVRLSLDLRSMKPFAQRLVIISGRQF